MIKYRYELENQTIETTNKKSIPKGVKFEEFEFNESELLESYNQEKNISNKIKQYQELRPTDWYFTRFLETGQEVPSEILTQRQEIRQKYS